MVNYIIRRLVYMVPTVILVSIIVFSLLHLAGGDPAALMLGAEATEQDILLLRKEMGLDRPLPVQYITWFGRVVQGDLGRSIHPTHPYVSDLIFQRLPVTLELGLLALLLSVVIGIPFGAVAGTKRGSKLDISALSVSALSISMPSFLLSLVLIFVFSLMFRWLPPSGFVPFFLDPVKNLRYMVLPAVAMSGFLTAHTIRMSRSSMVDVMGQDFIVTAKAKGLSQRVIVGRHALKVALIPVVTIVGLQLAHILGTTVIIEAIFALPGLGKLTIDSVYARDFPVVQGSILFMSLVCVIVNLAVDIAYGYLDPRIKYD